MEWKVCVVSAQLSTPKKAGSGLPKPKCGITRHSNALFSMKMPHRLFHLPVEATFSGKWLLSHKVKQTRLLGEKVSAPSALNIHHADDKKYRSHRSRAGRSCHDLAGVFSLQVEAPLLGILHPANSWEEFKRCAHKVTATRFFWAR